MIEENAVSYQGNHTTDSELPPPRREKYMEQYGLYEAIPGMDQIEVFTGQPSKIIVAFGGQYNGFEPLGKTVAKGVCSMRMAVTTH